MDQLIVIKIGGNIIDDVERLENFLQMFAAIPQHKILIHGGGKLATKIATDLGIESKYIDGRRITDATTIDIVTMVYAGLINKKIVATLQKFKCNAIGLTGADANLIPASKREVKDIDYGFVGDIKTENINAAFINNLLQIGTTPVIAPITHNSEGQLLNTNADTIAQSIAVAMTKQYEVSLIYTFEKNGVLLNINDETTVIKNINFESYLPLKKIDPKTNTAIIFEGMIPKLNNAFDATKHGVKKVVIGKAEQLTELIAGTKGTTIQYE